MPSLLTVEIRPHVYRPDWSLVTKPAVRSAFDGSRPHTIRSCRDMGSETYSKGGFYLEDSPGALCERWPTTLRPGNCRENPCSR